MASISKFLEKCSAGITYFEAAPELVARVPRIEGVRVSAVELVAQPSQSLSGKLSAEKIR